VFVDLESFVKSQKLQGKVVVRGRSRGQGLKFRKLLLIHLSYSPILPNSFCHSYLQGLDCCKFDRRPSH
jgi:hypothetical protein